MNLIGKPPINPVLFYSGKTAGYALWVLPLIARLVPGAVPVWSSGWNQVAAYALIGIAAVIIIASAVTLGDATRLGIPDENTVLKHTGIYRFSRNPMYVGFNLLTIAAMVYSLHPVIIAAGVYSIIVYHLIICGEERFLESRFGDAYRAYCATVRRYF